MAKLKTATTRLSMAACVALMATLFATPAAAAERQNDNAVKQLLERIDNERDRFEDQLDGELKGSILRGPAGEVNVGRYLDDLQENVDRMTERFTSEYAASAEVTTVLRQGSEIQRFMAKQKPDFDGASEWNRLSGSLGQLAVIYGTSFPIAEGQQARRLNDDEVKKAAEDVAESADRFKNELDASLKNDKTIPEATREAAVREVDEFKKDAERLASTVDDDKPASGEAQALLQRAKALRTASSGRALSPAAKSAWGSVEGGLEKVGQAFNVSTPLP